MENTTYPYVSIIIPVFNEEKYIKKCLESINNLKYPKDRYEIIIVDNGSTDNTALICKYFTKSIYILPKLNVSELRNYGAKQAKGKIYAFIDGDCVADTEWLNYAIMSIKEDVCVTGADCRISPEATWVENAWGSQLLQGRVEVTHIGAANLIVPADIFNKIGGFEAKLKTGEDYEFSVRARSIAKIISDDRITVTHYGNPKTIRQFIKREIWHGLGAFGSLKRQLIDKPLIGTILFIIFLLLQMLSVAIVLNGGSIFPLCYSTVAMVLLLFGTVYYKRSGVKDFLHGIRLSVLYFIYYFSRTISLYYIIFNKTYVRNR
jgi:glycosyltransferase involved in cell wall biosynthesis